MIAIMKKELSGYFRSMIGYIFLTIFVFVTGLIFSLVCVMGQYADYTYALGSTSIMFLVIVPVLTMRMFAEEARQKTDLLLYTSPVPTWRVVLAKFSSAIILLLIGFAITLIFPFVISFFGAVPVAKTANAIFGFILMGACLISICMFISVLTDNQIIAAVISFVVLFVFYFLLSNLISSLPPGRTASLIFIGICAVALCVVLWDASKNWFAALILFVVCAAVTAVLYIVNPLWFDGLLGRVAGAFALLDRFNNFGDGILSLSDVVYYLSFTGVFVYLTVHVIERRRWR